MTAGSVFARMPRAPMRPGETLAQFKRIDPEERHRRIDEARNVELTRGLPSSWVRKLVDHWRQRYVIDHAAANLAIASHAHELQAAGRAGVPADATDADICDQAKDTARECVRRMHDAEAFGRVMLDGNPNRDRLCDLGRLLALLDFADGLGLGDHVRAAAARSIDGAMQRAADDRWWRRVLRKLHARSVEATARRLGLVHKHAGCYVSDDALRRRKHQRARNAASLDAVIGVNDEGQAFTLAELAAKGTANKEIRRHELMTRIAGFELIAKDCAHVAQFVTVTCPSRMHAQRTTRAGRVEPNPKFDGTTPDAAQRYLSEQWARFRAAAERARLQLYGFRIAEPNHDATPHWHMLLFLDPTTTHARVVRTGDGRRAVIATPPARMLVRLLRRYFLRNADHDEPGARAHRVKAERIDWSKGSAAGYIAKYVAKNIDGYRVERDLYGNAAIESSQRVEAWAATWRIRQFQQIGGAPVTIWRELRRLNELQGEASPLVQYALDAVNTIREAAEQRDDSGAGDIESQQTAAHGWATYLHLQGGPRVPRRALRITLLREPTGELGRYREPTAPRTFGVVARSVEQQTMQPLGIILRPWTIVREVRNEVESERHSWVILPRSQRIERMSDGTEVRPMHSAAAGLRVHWDARSAAPWSPVNNCTVDASQIAGVARRRLRKRGWVTDWHRRREAAKPPQQRTIGL